MFPPYGSGRDPQMDKLMSIHLQERWHDCPDGYRWMVSYDGQGSYLRPGGGVLARLEHVSRSRVETRLLRILEQHRRM